MVVGVSAAMLIGGVALATTAGAQETPGIPGLPGFSIPDFMRPYFGGGQVHHDAARPQARPADDSRHDDYRDRQWAVQHDAAAPQKATAQRATAQKAAAQKAAAQKAARTPVREQRAAVQHNAQQDAAQQAGNQQNGNERAANVRSVQRNATQRNFAQQSGQESIVAASRDTVTASDISESPASPVEQRVLYLVNQNRRQGGCRPLSLDRRLIEAANDHAYDMVRQDYFEHNSPNGDTPGDRVTQFGYDWRKYGENIARGQTSAWQVVDGWMHSPEHRENIMNCQLDQMGVGLAISGDDTPYWVQDFATPMK